jgi:hypothetical protein
MPMRCGVQLLDSTHTKNFLATLSGRQSTSTGRYVSSDLLLAGCTLSPPWLASVSTCAHSSVLSVVQFHSQTSVHTWAQSILLSAKHVLHVVYWRMMASRDSVLRKQHLCRRVCSYGSYLQMLLVLCQPSWPEDLWNWYSMSICDNLQCCLM